MIYKSLLYYSFKLIHLIFLPKTVFQIGYTIPTLNFKLFIGNVPLKLAQKCLSRYH